MVSAKTKSMALLTGGFVGGGLAMLAGVPQVAPGIIGAGVLGFVPYHAIAQDEASMKLAKKEKKLKDVI
jgi:hypothetical protein